MARHTYGPNTRAVEVLLDQLEDLTRARWIAAGRAYSARDTSEPSYHDTSSPPSGLIRAYSFWDHALTAVSRDALAVIRSLQPYKDYLAERRAEAGSNPFMLLRLDLTSPENKAVDSVKAAAWAIAVGKGLARKQYKRTTEPMKAAGLRVPDFESLRVFDEDWEPEGWWMQER